MRVNREELLQHRIACQQGLEEYQELINARSEDVAANMDFSAMDFKEPAPNPQDISTFTRTAKVLTAERMAVGAGFVFCVTAVCAFFARKFHSRYRFVTNHKRRKHQKGKNSVSSSTISEILDPSFYGTSSESSTNTSDSEEETKSHSSDDQSTDSSTDSSSFTAPTRDLRRRQQKCRRQKSVRSAAAVSCSCHELCRSLCHCQQQCRNHCLKPSPSSCCCR